MTVLDKQLIFCEAQHITHTTASEWKYVVGDNYIDLGEKSADTWGDGKVTRPGWWIADNLTFVFKNAYAAPSTDSGANAATYVKLFGAADTSKIVTPPDAAFTYQYFTTGPCLGAWPKTYPFVPISQFTIPRVYHRYLFIVFEAYDVFYGYFDAWIGFGGQFLTSTKLIHYPGNTE